MSYLLTAFVLIISGCNSGSSDSLEKFLGDPKKDEDPPQIKLTFDPASYDFGSLITTAPSPLSKSVTVKNETGLKLFIASVSGTSSTHFTLSSETCTGLSTGLAVGESCTFVVLFKPTTGGLHNFAVNFSFSATEGQTDLTGSANFLGTGLLPANLQISDGPIFDFGAVVATAFADKTFQVTNAGDVPATNLMPGGLAAPFSYKGGSFPGTGGSCSTSLGPATSCTIVVTFNPATTGLQTATMAIGYDNGDTTTSITRDMQGTGATPALVTVSDSPGYDYGIFAVGATADRTFTLNNSGGVPASVLTGSGLAVPFSFKGGNFPGAGGTCGASLGSGGSCTIVVTYSPVAPGTLADSIDIGYFNGLSGQTSSRAIQGTAVPPAVLTISDGPTYDFGTRVTTSLTDHTFTIQNTGGYTASFINGSGLANPFTFKGGGYPGTGGSCGVNLSSGSSCTIVVSYNPTTAGSFSDTIEIAYSNGAISQLASRAVQGLAVDPANITISDGPDYDFGTRPTGSSTDHTFTLTNVGGTGATTMSGTGLSAPLTFKGGSYPGTGGTCAANLNPSATCTIVVNYSPVTTGPHASTITINYTNGLGAASSSRNTHGLGVGPAVLSMSDSPFYDYGTQPIGKLVDKTITISNTGGYIANGISGSGLAAPFSFKGGTYPGTGGTCSNTLNAGVSCSIIITYQVAAAVASADTVEVGYNDGVNAQQSTRDIQGTGVTPASLAVSDGPTFDYGPVATGGVSEKIFTVTNSGTFTASSIAGSGLAAPFTFKGGTYPGTGGNCATTLAGGASCTVVVLFSPVTTGTQSDVLEMNYNDGVVAQTASRTVQGVGTLPATLTISDGPTYNYPTLPYGATATKSFIVTNVGGVPASSMAGTGLAAPFTFLGGSYPGTGGNCASTLAASATCTIVVEYAPSVSGTLSDAIEMNYFDTVAAQTSTRGVSGTAVNPANIAISDGPTFNFSTVAVGGTKDGTLTLTNSGQYVATSLSGGGLSAPFSFKGGSFPGTGGNCSASLNAGASCTVVINYAPTLTGTQNSTMQINYNNGASAQVSNRNVQGTGAAPATLSISDSPSFDFGTYATGSSGDKVFTITNTGGVTASSIAGGGLAAPFVFKGGVYPGTGGTCTASLNSGDNCTVVVTYSPVAAGTLSDTMEINYDNGVGAQVSNRVMQGTGVNPALITFADAPSYDFGTIPNTGSAEKVVTISNTGNFTASAMTGTGLAAPFTFKGGAYPGTGGSCGATLSAGSSCTMVVVFNPSTLGPQSDTLDLGYHNGASVQTASLGLQGTSAPPGLIAISHGPTYNFGSWPNGAVREHTLTLTNNGGVAVSSMTGSGLGAPYSFKGGSYPGTGGNCAATLAVTASCTVVVQYSPLSVGTTSDTLQIDYNNGLSAQVSTRDLTGTSVPPAVLAISDGPTFDYNTVAVGGAVDKTFTITNTGGYAASSVSGAGIATPFTFKGGSFPGTGGTCTTGLTVGGSCTVVVTYAPSSTGLHTDDLEIFYNDGVNGQTASRAIQGTGAAPALLTVSDGATFDYGNSPVGAPIDKSFTVTNSGGVTATSIAGTGLSSPFNFKGGTFPGTGGNCAATLAASASCTMVVTFSPVSVGSFSGQIQVNYFDGVNSQSSLRAVQAQGVAPATLAISDGPSYDFGTRANGSSTDHTLTISNTGSWPATAMSGSGLLAPFTFKGGAYPGSGGTCSGSLANGSSCSIVVTFSPTAPGIHPDTIDISYNNGASTQTSSRDIQGTGAAPASLSLTDGPLFDFQTKATGSSTDKTITLSNSGGVPATSISGTGLAAPFTFKGGSFPGTGGNCGTTLNAGASCILVVSFAPTATGFQNDTAEINYNDGVTAQMVSRPLQGTGALPASITISDAPSFDYGTIAVGGSSDKAFTIQNIGGVPATAVSGGGLAAPYTFKGGSFPGTGGNCAGTLNASASCTIVVTFTPSVGGIQSDDIEISYTDGVTLQTSSRNVTGTAVTPANLVISDGATFDFGTVPATSTNDKVFTVTNSGSLIATTITGTGLAAPFSFKGGSYPGSGGSCGSSLNGGATCTIIVTYSPSVNGGSSDTIELPYYDGANNQTALRPVQGTAAPPASLSLSGGPTYNFGNIAVGGFADATITITNGGGVPATAISGTGLATPYTFKGGTYPGTGGTCTTTLNASSNCTIVVTYNPVTLGSSSDVVEVNYNNGLTAQMATLSLAGNAVNPAALTYADAPSYNYGTHATGSVTSKSFTITNTGDVTATSITGPAISAPYGFRGGSYPGTGGSCSTTLNASASCTIVVDYSPVSTGAQGGSVGLNFFNGATSTSSSLNLQGTGANPANLTITESPFYDYGILASGGSKDHTFTINNIGGVSALAIAGSGLAAPFSFKGGSYPGTGGNCATSLAAGGSCTVVVTYSPTNINSHSDAIEISYNDEVNNQTLNRNIQGQSVAPATITISDGPTHNYGLLANGAVADKSFTLTNAGSFQATLVTGGGLAAPFSFKGGSFPGTGGNCSGSLNAGATCTIVVSFSPTVTGAHSDAVEINYNDGAANQLSTRALQGSSAAPAQLAVSETGSWDFGTRATGSVNEKSFTITNSGGITATSIAGTGLSTPYSYKAGSYPGTGGTCSTSLAAGATCTVIVVYAPVSTGASSSSVDIGYNDGVTTQTASRGVQGVGATPASLAISDPVTYDFGSIANGGIAEKIFTVTNSGGVPATTMAGAGLATPFFFKGGSYPGTGGTCTATLNASATCTMVTTFNPNIAGLQSDTIELDYNDGVTSQQTTRPLQGTGVTPAIITISDGPTFDFGPVVATASVDKTFTLSNSGSLTATTLSGSGLVAPFTFKGGTFPGTGGNCGVSLNAGANCTVVVTFNPTVTGPFSDAVDITYYDGANNQLSARAIQGSGATPASLTLSGGPTYNFGQLAQNGTVDGTITVTNGGGVPATSMSGSGLAAPYTFKGGSYPGTGGSCTTSLAPAANCTLVINFNPTTIAVHTDTVEVSYQDGLTSQMATRNLTGEAVAPALLAVSDAGYDYGIVPTGGAMDKAFTITNNGAFPASGIGGTGLIAPYTFKGGSYPGTGGSCTANLNASASCTVVVTFAPTVTGAQGDTIEINYYDGANNQMSSRAISGTGATPASLALSDTNPYDFGTRANGSATDKSFTLSNSGGVTATGINGSGLIAPFSFKGGTFPGTGGNCTSSLASAGSCTIVVTFAPTVSGAHNNTMVLGYSNGVSLQNISKVLDGTGAAPANLALSDGPTYNFGSKANGSTTDKTITMNNGGSFTATSITGTGLAAPYTFKGGSYPGTGGNCSTTLAPAGSCTMVVTYAPSVTGTHNDTIDINYHDGAVAQLSQRDLTGTSAPPAALTISDAAFSFGVRATGSSTDKTFTVTNSGGVDALAISVAALSSPYSFKGGSYPGTGGDCSTTLVSAASCTVVVTYSPVGTGTHNSSLDFTFNDGVTASQTSNRSFTGTGAAPALIAVSESGTYDYGSVATGGSSDHTFTLTNSGGVPAASLTGSGLAAPFSFKGGSFPGTGGDCTNSLNASSACTIVVTFTPSVGGLASDTIEIGYHNGVSAQSSTRGVQGTGVTPANLTISDATTYDFGAVVATGSADKTFTITNSGDLNATVMAGTGLAAPFIFKGGSYPGTGGNCSTSLAGSGATCTVVVTFNPSVTGPFSDTIELNYHNGVTSVTSTRGVQGTGATPATLNLSGGPTYNFNTLAQNGSADGTITVTNGGGVPTTAISGTGLAAPYTFKGGTYPGTGGNCGTTLLAGANCTVVINYNPTTIATHNDTLDMDFHDGLANQTSSRNLTGQAVAPASLAVSDPGYDFGTVPTGGSSDHTFTVTNSGAFTATAVGGAGLSAPFTFKGGSYPGTGGDCSATLNASASCTIVVTFAPVGTGAQNATIQVNYFNGASNQNTTRPITGTGAAPALLTLSDSNPWDFGTRANGSSTDKTFVLTNSGGVNATGIGGSGLAAPFTFKGGSFPGTGGNCGTSLSPSANCNIVVTYNPTVAGLLSDTMDINYNNGVSGQLLSKDVQGTGALPANLAVSDGPTYNYGLRANGSSTDHSFTITNSGSFTASGMTGNGLSAPYSFKGGSYPGTGGNCSTTLAAAGTCTVVVTYAPGSTGTYNGTFNINYNNGASAQASSRDVTGTSAPPASFTISDSGFNFGTQATGSSTDKTFTVTNSGGVDATGVSIAALSTPYSFKGGTYPGTGGNCGTTLASTATCSVVVTYAPVGTGVHNGSLDFTFNDGITASQTASRAFTGTGAAPASIAISETGTYDYGQVATGGSSDHSFTISNSGGVNATSVAGTGLAAPFTFKGGSFPGTGGNCTTSLAPSSNCTIVVTFAPTVGGLQSDSIDIGYQNGVSAQTSSRGVQGTGVTPASLAISDGATFNYGSVVATGAMDKTFTITNSGDQAAASMVFSGLAAPFDFKGGSFPGSGGNCGSSLAGGGSTCTVVITFNPGTTGAFSDTLVLDYNNGVTAQNTTRPMQGSGATAATLTLSAGPTYNFGILAQNSSADVTITVNNTGGVTANSLVGTGLAAPYSFKGGSYPGTAGTCTTTLAASGSCTIVVTYNPTTVATHNDAVEIDYDNGLSTQTASRALTGQAVAPASLAVSDPGYDFGTVATGASLDKTFTITNNGAFTATVVGGTGLAAPFTFKGGSFPGTGGNCTNTLNAAASCDIVVTFAPSGTGAQNDTIEINYYNGSSSQTANRLISGTGAAPANLTLSDTNPYDFGTRATGSSTDKIFTLTNSGGVTATGVGGSGLATPYTFKGGSFPGTGGGDCLTTLAPGMSCQIVVTYNPGSQATHTDTMNVAYNNGVSAQLVAKDLTGVGAAPALIAISNSDPYDYGNVAVGGNADHTFTITNNGGVTAASLNFTGLAAPFDFKGSGFPGTGGNCASSLSAGNSCTVVVTFTPAGTGSASDTLDVAYNNGASAQTSSRSMQGTGASPANLSISETGTYNYGIRAQGSSTDHTFTINNSGGVTATGVSGTGLAIPFSFKDGTYPGTGGNCSNSINAGGSCTIVVTFAPSSISTFGDTIEVNYSNGVSAQQATRALSGEAVAAGLLAINGGPTFSFGTMANGASAEHTFTVTNNGGFTTSAMSGGGLTVPFSYKGGNYPGTGGTCDLTLLPTNSCTLVVVFAPNASATHNSSVDISYNNGASTVSSSRAVQGVSAAPALMTIGDGPTYNYATVATTATAEHTFTVSNSGGIAATSLSGGGLAAPYAFKGGSFPGAGGSCTGSVNPGGSCTIVVTFAPSLSQAYNDTIEFGYNNGLSAQQATRDLTGTGAAPALLAISNSPGYDYGTTPVGGARDHTFTISNTGGVNATSVIIGGLAAPFNFKGNLFPGTGGNCGSTLNGGQSCTVVITYSPVGTGAQSDAIEVSYNDGAVTQNLSRNIQGVGANPASLAFSGTNSFGNRANGGSTDQYFTLTNNGGVDAVSIAGAGLGAPYTFTGGSFPGSGGNCSTTLGPAQSCQVQVTFSPTTTATHNGTLQATYNDGVANQTASYGITGTSTAPAQLLISETDPYDFGTQLSGTSTDKVFTVTNGGNFTANSIVGAGLDGAPFLYKNGTFPGTGGNCGTSLAPSANCSIVVTYAPSTANTFNDDVSISYNNGASLQAAVRLVTGTAIIPVPPSSPGNPTLSLQNFSQLHVAWTASPTGTGPITYAIERTTTSGSGYSEIVNSLASLSYDDSGVTAGVTYYYRVKATGPGGTAYSGESIGGSAIASFDIASLTAGDRNATIAWSNATGATSYTVKYGTSPGAHPSVATNAGVSPQLVTPLTAGTRYYFMVTAVNATGQLNAPLEFDVRPIAIPIKLARGASSESHCAIMSNGDLRCWGQGSYGKLGNGGEANYGDDEDEVKLLSQTALIGSGLSVSEMYVGNFATHLCAKMDNGAVKCWGRNLYGQLGYGDVVNRGHDDATTGDNLGSIDIGSRTVAKLSLGEFHTCMLTTSNEVYCWGRNNEGQLGLNHTTTVGTVPAQMGAGLNPVNLGGQTPVDIVSGAAFNCALMSTGAVRCWGLNTSGQLGIGNIVAPRDRIGNQANEMTTIATNVDLGAGITASEISAGATHVCARLIDSNPGNPLTNSVKCWGAGGEGRTGYEGTGARGTTAANIGDNLPAVALGTGVTAKKIVLGATHSCIITNTDTLKCWGSNVGGALGQATGAGNHRGDAASEMGVNLPESNLGAGLTVDELSAGEYTTCAKLSNGATKCWGENGDFQQGNGDDTGNDIGDAGAETGNAILAMDVGAPARSVAASYPGRQIICHIRDDGSLVCYGNNNYGRMLLATLAHTGDDPDEMGQNMISVNLGVGRTAKEVTMGQFHTCVILDTDQVKCWGRNTDGRLGLGDTNHRNKLAQMDSLPVLNFGGGRTAKAISAGVAHTCAILNDDTVKCWGLNTYGQLGYDDAVSRGGAGSDMGNGLPIVNLGVGRTAKKLAVGHHFSCAILDTDNIKCWGRNNKGQLGVDSTANRGVSTNGTISMNSLPTVNLGSGTTATAIAAGSEHTCAITHNGYMKCWGEGDSGRLGSGSTTDRGTAANPMSALAVIDFGGLVASKMSVGAAHACVIFTSNGMKCFGAGGSGRTGHNNTTDLGGTAGQTAAASTNTSIGASRYAIEVTAASTSSCSIGDDNQIRCWGNNTVGQLGIGSVTVIGDGGTEMGDNLEITVGW